MRETLTAAEMPAAAPATRSWGRRIGTLVLLAMLPAGAAVAQHLPGEPEEGRELARQWCVECHDLTPGSREPSAVAIARPEEPGEVVIVEAPAFQAIADNPGATEAALRFFLQTPHANMPNLRLSLGQADAVIAYILSLKGVRPGT
jgi:mono/diheme cytochrome c family protein